MKRLCIYVTYDAENIIDDYIGYMLRELRKVVECLVVVCNYEVVASGMENIQPYADKIYYRKNIGFDAGAYKDVMCNLMGWNNIVGYDELLLINDSFFGPFMPFEVIFDQMENRENDFWGLTIQAETNGFFGEIIPEHIQSFFIAVQKKLLISSDFRDYWEKISYFDNFSDVVNLHEIRFTEYFSTRGYSYSALADTSSNDTLNKQNNFNQYMMISYELIRKRNFPFLKRQQISYNTLYGQTQENLRMAIEYINSNTDYNVNLIWNNIIRTMNISDLHHSLHLQYILSDEEITCKEHSDAVIAVSADYVNACEYVIEYLKPMISLFNVRVYAKNEEILNFYQNYGIVCTQKSLDTYMGIKELSVYKYVCIIHDEDMTSKEVPSYVHKSSFFNIWENLLKSVRFVERLIYKLDSECRLGFLAPPQANFGKYFDKFGKGWDGRYSDCYRVIYEKKVRCKISQDKPPFVITENFWIRGEILSNLERFKDIDFGIMKYIWIYLAQEKCYFSGIVESAEYASINEVNKQYYLNEICYKIRQHCGEFNNFLDIKKVIFKRYADKFCSKHTKIYIYGIGSMAKTYKNIIPHIEGFIVTDGQPNRRMLDNIPVYYLSEVQFNDEVGVIVCVDRKIQSTIETILYDKGINYICI